MEDWAIRQEQYAIAIRVPEGKVYHTTDAVDTDYSDINRFKVMHRGSRVAILAAGNFFQKGERVCRLLANKGIDATLINPRWLSGIDEQLLNELKNNHELVVTLEDGSLDGGFGERISRYYGTTSMRVLNCGVRKQLYDRYDVEQLLEANHLKDEQIVADVMQLLSEH